MSYHHYLFFRIDRQFHLQPSTIGRQKREFLSVINKEASCLVFSYVLLGLKGEIAFMLWVHSPQPAAMQEFLNKLLKTKLGTCLSLVNTLFGIVRPSAYVKKQTVQEQAIEQRERLPYLIVYPFTKTDEWYRLPFETRKTMMMEHIRIGHTHTRIRQLLLYAYGVDDHEFIVSYETRSLEDFQQLIIDLRGSQARKYTANDLPIFPCVYQPIERVLEML